MQQARMLVIHRTVYTKPTPSGVYNYYATVKNLITANATPTTNGRWQ
ncbi:MAG: hypothetical protein R2765_03405 [Ferruginibacter sp.]